MTFFTRLKAQHIALLITQPSKRINWRLFGVLALTMLATGGVLYGLFGDQILAELSQMFTEETGEALPVPSEMMPWFLLGIPFMDILGELGWIALVAFITMRVVKYLKTPLTFKHVFNIYLLIRVYEMLVAFALLLGFTVVALYTGTETLPFLQEDASVAGVLSAFIIPVFFFWIYLSSVRFVTRKMPGEGKEVGNKE